MVALWIIFFVDVIKKNAAKSVLVLLEQISYYFFSPCE